MDGTIHIANIFNPTRIDVIKPISETEKIKASYVEPEVKVVIIDNIQPLVGVETENGYEIVPKYRGMNYETK